MAREEKVTRKTRETEISLTLNLDGEGKAEVSTGIPFMDHMLDSLARHGLFNLALSAKGDIEIDFHHTVEDIGICLGTALKGAVGDKQGIGRFGWACVPMDEALALVSLDLSGRPLLSFDADLGKHKIGSFDVEVIPEFFSGLVANSGMTLHVKLLTGMDTHHSIEAIFKAFAKALDMATSIDERISGIPSTKGML